MQIRSLVGFVVGVMLALCSAGCEKKASTGASDTHKPPATKSTTLRVFAAASLAEAFREIGAGFEAANPGIHMEFNFAGSNQLRTQLEQGASGDLFASADRKQMEAAAASKVVVTDEVRVFAINQLAVFVPVENKAGIRELADLKRPGLKIVVADQAVPVGSYTKKMLEKASADGVFGPAFVSAFEANVVSREQNVAAVIAKVALNEADAAIAYVSDGSGSNAAKLRMLPIPASVDQRAEYLISPTARAADPAFASRFVEYLLSPQGVEKLKARGFIAPGTEPK
jgi:molybdate transport system substrate-binding protein